MLWIGCILNVNVFIEEGYARFVALHRGKLVNRSDIEILTTYNAEVRGLYNYYSIANDSYKIGKFGNVMKPYTSRGVRVVWEGVEACPSPEG